jgi:dienelactone hydrolase
MQIMRFLLILTLACSLSLHADPVAPISEPAVGSKLAASDTLDLTSDPNADAQDCLAGLRWEKGTFTVTCESKTSYGDYLLRYPSALPSGDAVNDQAAIEWHVARDKDGKAVKAPAFVIVHESGRGMLVGRLFAGGLRGHGFHTFLVHLPGYGVRTSAFTKDVKRMLPGLKQAVADVRRARDAVAALPFVEKERIGLQGTSLGGFVVATTAGLDSGFHKAFVLLAGGELTRMILTGQRDAASFRKQLFDIGITAEELPSLTKPVEPMRLAHRVNPRTTWLFSGSQDEVVPPSCSHDWAKAAKLTDGHHQELPIGHYNAGMKITTIMKQIANLMRDLPMNQDLAPELVRPSSGKKEK